MENMNKYFTTFAKKFIYQLKMEGKSIDAYPECSKFLENSQWLESDTAQKLTCRITLISPDCYDIKN
jgi:hypothetical protein